MHWHVKCMSGRNQTQIISPFCVVSGLVSTLCLRLEKPAWGQRKCARPNADHWSIVMSVLAWWAHNTGIWKSLLGVNWSACDQTQIIGPFWCRFWLGEHIVMTFVNWIWSYDADNFSCRAYLLHFCWLVLKAFTMLTIQDFFSLFVDVLMIMILYILMENGRVVQQRQPVGNNEEQREQVRRSEVNTGNGEENQNHCVPPNTNYPTENDERQG